MRQRTLHTEPYIISKNLHNAKSTRATLRSNNAHDLGALQNKRKISNSPFGTARVSVFCFNQSNDLFVKKVFSTKNINNNSWHKKN